MKIVKWFLFVCLSSFGGLNAQIPDTLEIQYFKILEDALPYSEVFIACGLSDNGYFSIGSSVSEDIKYLSLKKYSLTGELIADFSLDDEQNGYKQVDYGRCLVQISENEWVLAYNRIENNNTWHIRVIRFNLQGEVLWQNDIEGNYWDTAKKILITEEKDIVIIGESYINNSLMKGYIVLLNEVGEIIWEKTDEMINITSHSGGVLHNDNLLVAGKVLIQGIFYPYLKKISLYNADLLEEKIFVDNINCACHIRRINNKIDEFYFTSCNNEEDIFQTAIIDTSFNILWERYDSFQDYYDSAPVNPIIYEDKTFVSLHEYYTYTQEGLRTQIEMFGLDPQGNLAFVTPIPTDPTKEVYVRDLRKTPDGGYLIAGYEHFPAPQRGWLIKTDSLGNTCQLPNCDSVAYVIDTTFTHNFNFTTAKAGLQLYPNPVKAGEGINVSLNNTNDAILQAQIFSIDGKHLYFNSFTETNSSHKLQIPSNGLIPGMYMLKLSTKSGILYSRRLLIE